MADQEKIRSIIAEIEGIIDTAKQHEIDFREYLDKVHPKFRDSARNLIHYRAMRTFDLRNLQKNLGALGLSRLAKAEGHVMASLIATINILKSLIGELPADALSQAALIKKGQKLLASHARELFGAKSHGRKVRIMVTMPGEAGDKLYLIRKMMEEGMNTIRINCAHDDPETWAMMIANVRKAMKTLGRTCRITMDLSGPKIRTGAIAAGPKVTHVKTPKDSYGRISGPAKVWLIPESHEKPAGMKYIPVDEDWLKRLSPGDEIRFIDARGKRRSLSVVAKKEDFAEAYAYKSFYLETGAELKAEGAATVGDLPAGDAFILLNKGELLIINKAPIDGEPAKYDDAERLIAPAHISCTSPEIFDFVERGEPVLFDDGKIEGVIKEAMAEEIVVEITAAREGGAKLRADKGINLPDTNLKISGLTAKDRNDLKFLARHADVVNMSFVNNKNDVQDLIDEIKGLGAENKLGIILKIETKSGFHNLVEILLTAMQIHPVGVMIARGDLAIECGWQNIGRIQEEMLWLCQAAHVPTVWATQVLENLAKKGIPSRAEITDAVMAQRADCVMLNKGPHIISAVTMLNHILTNMQSYQDKKAPMLPAIEMNFTWKA